MSDFGFPGDVVAVVVGPAGEGNADVVGADQVRGRAGHGFVELVVAGVDLARRFGGSAARLGAQPTSLMARWWTLHFGDEAGGGHSA